LTNMILLGHPKMDEDFWSWFAGFWEGEGCAHSRRNTFSYTNGKRYSRARLDVAQTDAKPIKYIIEQTGLGGMYIKPKQPNRKVCYVWRLDKLRDIIPVCEQMLPHLRFRNQQVQQFLRELKEWESEAKWIGWTAREIAILKELYSKASHEELKKMLNRRWPSIQAKAQKLGLRRRHNE